MINAFKIVGEYDQEYHNHKLQTTLSTAKKSHTTITRHQEDKQSKANSSLFSIKMIANLEWTQRNGSITEPYTESNIQQQINNNRTTALKRAAAKLLEALMHFTGTKSSP